MYFTRNIIISRRGDSDATEGNGREDYEGEAERQERLKAIAEEQLPPSSMDQIDEYMDMLYQGSSIISRLDFYYFPNIFTCNYCGYYYV